MSSVDPNHLERLAIEAVKENEGFLKEVVKRESVSAQFHQDTKRHLKEFVEKRRSRK